MTALGVRVLGTGHSFSPVIGTDGALLDLSALAGVMAVDADRSTVTALPATTVGMFGDPLWDLGFALHNQGDIATQQIAGAVATGTHGSGVELAGLSGMVRAMRLITGAAATCSRSAPTSPTCCTRRRSRSACSG